MEKRCIENNPPGDKPHIIEGNILVGNYEGATEVIVGVPRHEGKNTVVESRLFSIDARFPKSHKHRIYTCVDQLMINQEGANGLSVTLSLNPQNRLQVFSKNI